MVTEEEVRAYRYRPTVHADGRNEKGRLFMWACECPDNPRVVLRCRHGPDVWGRGSEIARPFWRARACQQMAGTALLNPGRPPAPMKRAGGT
jgi:hypothetical protein